MNSNVLIVRAVYGSFRYCSTLTSIRMMWLIFHLVSLVFYLFVFPYFLLSSLVHLFLFSTPSPPSLSSSSSLHATQIWLPCTVYYHAICNANNVEHFSKSQILIHISVFCFSVYKRNDIHITLCVCVCFFSVRNQLLSMSIMNNKIFNHKMWWQWQKKTPRHPCDIIIYACVLRLVRVSAPHSPYQHH